MFYHGLQYDLFGNLFGSPRHSSTFTGSETAANLNSGNAKTVTVKAKWKSNCTENCSDLDLSVNESVGFSYTGAVKGVTLKKAGYYKLEVWGAQGGDGYTSSHKEYGGPGGYSYGSISKTANDVLYVVVGGKGSYCTSGESCSSFGGYNGGGIGRGRDTQWTVGGGGGATHIATRTGLLSSLSSYTSSVLIVAGGGGGSGQWKESSSNTGNIGGNGGGIRGGSGISNYTTQPLPGTQSSGGIGKSNGCLATNGGFGYGGNGCTGYRERVVGGEGRPAEAGAGMVALAARGECMVRADLAIRIRHYYKMLVSFVHHTITIRDLLE